MSSNLTSQLKYALGIGGLFSFYAIAGLVTWFLGEYFGWTGSSRIIIIALILLTLPFVILFSLIAKWRKKRKAAKQQAAETETTTAKDQPSEKVSKQVATNGNLDTSAAEVVQFLKGSNLGTTGDALYSLPWYLVAGGTKSGKTSLVLGSDLDFQTLPSQRQSEQQQIRPTRQVDFRVTSDAVFVDLPGRFQAENSDGDEWATLIETIKKHRQKRPLDGLILAVNTEEVLNSDERDIEELAKTVRRNLDDATKRLKTRFPVYLVFTHADAIEGFRDSFSVSKKESENLVWGSTIPLDKSDNAQALFDSEYEVLQDSVMKRRLARLSAPFSPTRQLRIFNFPLHFGSARRKLGTFVTTLFRPNPFSESPFLRGFYFTAVPVNRKRVRGGKPAATPQTVGETFFTKRFFRDVILRDKDLVKTFQLQNQKPPILGWLLTILGTLLITVLLGLSAFSLYKNYQLIQEATAKGKAVLEVTEQDKSKSPLEKSETESQEEIDAIENLREVLVTLDEYEREGAPWYMRFGFYSGNKIYKEKLLNIYYSAIQRRFREPTIRKLEQELQTFASSTETADPTNLNEEQEKKLGKHFNLLSAYLLLSDEHKERAKGATTVISNSLKDYWVAESKLPKGNNVIAEENLNFYFKQIDREGEYEKDSSGFPRKTLDQEIVKATRDKLKNYPAYLRYLQRKISDTPEEIENVTVTTLTAGRDEGVISGTHKIPGAFTIKGYRKYMKEAIEKANEEIRKEDWVMGKTDVDAQVSKDEIERLKERYFNQYIDEWRELIRKTNIIEFKQLEDMKKGLRAFSDAESPMKVLLTEVARNTKFSSKPEPKAWTDLSWITDKWNGIDPTAVEEGNNPVEIEFEALAKFVGLDSEGDTTKSTMDDKYGSAMNSLNQTFGKINASEKGSISRAIEEKNKESDEYKALDIAENRIDSATKVFKNDSEDIAILLKQPLVQIRSYFGVTASKQLKDDWANRILPQAKEIESGYPFTDDGEADLTKLSKFLNPVNGELSKFYKDRLDEYFEEVNGKLRVKDSSKYKFSPAFVDYLNNAFKLREVLYGKGNTSVNFKYDFRLMKVENAIIEITIDGQKVTSEATGSSTFGFPAAQGTGSGVLMRFSSTDDTSSTSGDTLPPNSSANNSNSSVNSTSPSTPASPTSNFFQDSNEEKKTFQGTWGLFKFVDAGNKNKEGDVYNLTYKLGDKTVKATIKPQGGDPFDKSLFRNVKVPQAILE